MPRKLVLRTRDVVGFSPQDAERSFISKLLIDQESVGSDSLVMNYFALRPGKSTSPGGKHPAPYDEIYYVLRGYGRLQLGDEPEFFDLEPDTVAFIPAGTKHSVDSTGDHDLELITVMAGPLRAGINPIYDERLSTWGTSFKLHSEPSNEESE